MKIITINLTENDAKALLAVLKARNDKLFEICRDGRVNTGTRSHYANLFLRNERIMQSVETAIEEEGE